MASRSWLAAGALPNARGYLAGWILDPQTPKPGARMPQHTFTGEDLTALLDYLETLK
jgi:cytochrome c oxidase subunit 2